MSRPRPDPHRSRIWPALLAAVVMLGTAAVASPAQAGVPAHVAFGYIDVLVQSGTGLDVAGWAIDPDTHNPIYVDMYVDGHRTRLAASNTRPDIERAYPAYGARHGFATRFPVAGGRHTVCIYAINYGLGGTNPLLGCRTITVNFDPFGEITTVRQNPGGFTMTGWAIDHDQPQPPLAVKLSVDGVLTAGLANLTRADVAQRYPGSGPLHGFAFTAPASEGVHRVCVLATNIGLGANATVACQSVTLNFSPTGAITSLTQAPGGFRVQGWAFDPDTSAKIAVTVWAGGVQVGTSTANLASSVHDGHGFDATYKLGTGMIPPGVHNICVKGVNAGTFGSTRTVACQSVTTNYNATATITSIARKSPGYQVAGWATDPDTPAPIRVIVTTDGKVSANVVAAQTGGTHPGHAFVLTVAAVNGRHTVCAAGVNARYGAGPPASSCVSVVLDFNPIGAFEKVARVAGSPDLQVTGWALDPDTTTAIGVRVSVDGRVVGTPSAALARADVAKLYPGSGPGHGLSARVAASDGEHSVCATAVNVLGGTGDTSLGCKIINAVHPVVPSAPKVTGASGGYGTATVTWTAPAGDGGAPWTSYLVTAAPGHSVRVGPLATSATVGGLASSHAYRLSVVANNVAGDSPAGVSASVLTKASPPPQTTPAPVSTSRYIRNVSAASAAELVMMRSEGATDAGHNPSGHSYLILLDIGGQTGGGVMLSATTRFVSYPNLVKDINAYVDGYASAQKASAPVVIAIGTNNDMDVSAAAGTSWAASVVNPVVAHALRLPGLKIAGANDIEPGFRGSYTQTAAWLLAYLHSTSAPFVFNGSADGCAWTATARGCNNGWSMAGLYQLSAGAAPSRIVNLPQIYNNTMAAQWKYISLTGVGLRQPRINFGGALTEWTACAQAGGCGSLTGVNAWQQMWSQLQSHASLRVTSLPYSTDLRIDR